MSDLNYVLGKYVLDKIFLVANHFLQRKVFPRLSFSFCWVHQAFMQYEYDFPPLLFLLKIHCQEIVKHKCIFHPFIPGNKTSVFHVPALISVSYVIYCVVKHGIAFKEVQSNDVILKHFLLNFKVGQSLILNVFYLCHVPMTTNFKRIHVPCPDDNKLQENSC